MNESNLSNNPPCPGIMPPESFILAVLLSSDATKSPRNAAKIIPNVINIERTDISPKMYL